MNVPFKIHVINTYYGFKHWCCLYRCPRCFWVLSVTLSGNKLRYAKIKLKPCPFTGFDFFFSLNCHVSLFLPYESTGAKCLSPFPDTFIADTVLSDLSPSWKKWCLTVSSQRFLFFSLFSSLFSSPFSRLCVWRILFEASNQKFTLEVAGNLVCFYQNDENYSCWNTFWWKACPFFKFGTTEKKYSYLSSFKKTLKIYLFQVVKTLYLGLQSNLNISRWPKIGFGNLR